MKKFKNTPTHIANHHSATSRDFTKFETVRKNHIAEGYDDIAYHFVIDGKAKRHTGRPIEYQGCHAGAYNSKAIAILTMGHFDKEVLLEAQKKELEKLHKELLCGFLIQGKRFFIPRQNIKGHGEVMNTKCPGKNLMNWIKEYRKIDPTPPIVKPDNSELNRYKNAIKQINLIINKLEFNN